MSDTETLAETPVPEEQPVPSSIDESVTPSLAPIELAVPLSTFAATVGPRMGDSTIVRNGVSVRVRTLLPGEPDEVWLKLLEIRHRNERHTMTEWRNLIERYRHEPAHPAHPEYGKVN